MSETRATAQARQIVDEFGAAFAKKDFSGARRLLHDDLSFHGPIDTCSRADDYVASITRLGAMMKGLRHEKTIVESNEVAVFYVLDTALGSAPVADWYTVRGGKIASIRTYFDARPFAPPAGKAAGHWGRNPNQLSTRGLRRPGATNLEARACRRRLPPTKPL